MSKESDQFVEDVGGPLIFFLAGLVICSFAVGVMAPHAGWGWLVLGVGFMALAMLAYLEPKKGDKS